MSMPLLRPTFWALGSPLAQRAPRRMYPASRSTPCPAGPGLPGFLTMRSASLSACCLSLLGMPSGSLYHEKLYHARILLSLKSTFLGICNGLNVSRFLIRRSASLSACCLSLLGMSSGSVHAYRAASSHRGLQSLLPHESCWGTGKELPVVCGERGR